MSHTSVRTRTGIETKTATTFVNNELMSGFMSIAIAAGADTRFLRNCRHELTGIFEMGLERRILDQVRCQILDGSGRVREEWVFEVTYDGDCGLVEFPVDQVRDEVSNVDHLEKTTLVVKPIVDGIDVFERNDDATRSTGSFGAGDIDVDVGRDW